ncbi:MAG: hypothetical protein AAGD88_14950 [Bacteroidota bacterium]
MNKVIKHVLFYALVFCVTSCEEKKEPNPIIGNWSTRYIIIDDKELLGYLEDTPTFRLKPAIFTEDNSMIVFLEAENKTNIQAKYFLKSTDSIQIESAIANLSGVYRIEMEESGGRKIMKFKAPQKEMYFEQNTASVRY